MTSLPDDWNDIWTTLNPQQLATDNVALKLDIINDIQPLDDQFGADPKKTAPDALYGVLFGQSQPSDVEIAVAGGDPQNVPPIQTYALLDAAKITHLPEMLGASDLEHSCLFKGAAYEELKDVAPWLVRLEEGNDFTRNLFTAGCAPWHLWEREAGVYIRSRASLEELWRHFRKFNRIQDENQKWYYLNIADIRCIWDLAQGVNNHEKSVINAMFYSPLVVNLTSMHGVKSSSFFSISKNLMVLESHTTKYQAVLSGRDIEILSHIKRTKLADTVTAEMVVAFPEYFKGRSPNKMRLQAFRTIERMVCFGFDQTYQIRHLAAWGLFYGEFFETKDPSGELDRISRSSLPANDKFSEFARRMHQIEAMK